MLGVDTRHLTHAQILLGDVELLEVAAQQLLGGLAVHRAGGEQFTAQIVQRYAGHAGQTLGHGDIPLGAGGGLEHDRIRQDGRRHQARHMGRGHDAVLLIHGGDNGVGAAHRLVADVDGLAGLDIRQTVVIHDGQDLRLLDARHSLGQLVMIHQHHLLASWPQQMVTGQGADHLLLLIQHGIAAVAALQHHLADVVDIIIQMEADQIAGGAGAGDGDGLIDQAVDAAGVKGSGDDAGLARVLDPLRIHIGLAQDQAGHLHVQRAADHIRLAAAQHDAVGAVEQQVLAALGQGNGHAAGQGIHQVAALAHDAALDNAEEVEHGDLLHHGVGDGVQAEGGDVTGGQHAV